VIGKEMQSRPAVTYRDITWCGVLEFMAVCGIILGLGLFEGRKSSVRVRAEGDDVIHD
jgi:hypothetical protein